MYVNGIKKESICNSTGSKRNNEYDKTEYYRMRRASINFNLQKKKNL